MTVGKYIWSYPINWKDCTFEYAEVKTRILFVYFFSVCFFDFKDDFLEFFRGLW